MNKTWIFVKWRHQLIFFYDKINIFTSFNMIQHENMSPTCSPLWLVCLCFKFGNFVWKITLYVYVLAWPGFIGQDILKIWNYFSFHYYWMLFCYFKLNFMNVEHFSFSMYCGNVGMCQNNVCPSKVRDKIVSNT